MVLWFGNIDLYSLGITFDYKILYFGLVTSAFTLRESLLTFEFLVGKTIIVKGGVTQSAPDFCHKSACCAKSSFRLNTISLDTFQRILQLLEPV